MAQAEFEEVLAGDTKKLFEVITHYEDYPEFVDGVTSVKVKRSKSGSIRVFYEVSMVKDIQYVLDLKEDAKKGMVSWTLVESDFLEKNTGSWQIKSAGADKTKVHYKVDLEFKVPVPGFVLSRIIKGNLPSMVKSFEKRAKALKRS